ncbi:unnamed protein product [Prorocentrum cordatum]|nr:unnamed protein product [Polarella glacialis]
MEPGVAWHGPGSSRGSLPGRGWATLRSATALCPGTRRETAQRPSLLAFASMPRASARQPARAAGGRRRSAEGGRRVDALLGRPSELWLARLALASGLGFICGWSHVVSQQRFSAFVAMLTGNTIYLSIAACGGKLVAAAGYLAIIASHLAGTVLYHLARRLWPAAPVAAALGRPMALLAVAGELSFAAVGARPWQACLYAPAFGVQGQLAGSLGVQTTMITGCLHKLAEAAAACLAGQLTRGLAESAVLSAAVVGATVAGVASCVLVTRRLGSTRWCLLPVALLQALLLTMHDRLPTAPDDAR